MSQPGDEERACQAKAAGNPSRQSQTRRTPFAAKKARFTAW
jgi:hypothetical protein